VMFTRARDWFGSAHVGRFTSQQLHSEVNSDRETPLCQMIETAPRPVLCQNSVRLPKLCAATKWLIRWF
jgi:hypothetical protein